MCDTTMNSETLSGERWDCNLNEKQFPERVLVSLPSLGSIIKNEIFSHPRKPLQKGRERTQFYY